jgi:hypothetical protein
MLLFVTDMQYGVAHNVFLRAALAYLYQHPVIVFQYTWENLVDFTIRPAWICRSPEVFPAYRSPRRSRFYPAASDLVVLAPGGMPDKAYRFLTSREVSQSTLMRAADSAWQLIYRDVRGVLLASMLVWLGGILLGDARITTDAQCVFRSLWG